MKCCASIISIFIEYNVNKSWPNLVISRLEWSGLLYFIYSIIIEYIIETTYKGYLDESRIIMLVEYEFQITVTKLILMRISVCLSRSEHNNF